MKTETEQALELVEKDIVDALDNLRDSHVTDNLHRLGTLGKGNVDMATTILDGRLKMMRRHPPAKPADHVFVIVIEDRHSDIGLEVWTDRQAAIDRARALATENCRHEVDFKESTIPGCEYYVEYSCESDNVRVIKTQVKPVTSLRPSRPVS